MILTVECVLREETLIRYILLKKVSASDAFILYLMEKFDSCGCSVLADGENINDALCDDKKRKLLHMQTVSYML